MTTFEGQRVRKKWEQELKSGYQKIDAIQELTWDTFWSYLVKPHSQQLNMKCLSHAIANMLPEFSDATYTGQLHSCLSHPPEVKDMLLICQLHTSDTQKVSKIYSDGNCQSFFIKYHPHLS